MDNIMINDLWSMMHHSSYSIIIHHLSSRSRSWLQADIIMVDKTIVKLPRSLKTYTLSTAHNFTRINQKDSKWFPSKFCLGHPSVIWVLGLSFPNRIVCATPEQSLKILSKSGELTLPFQFLLRKEASFSKQLFFQHVGVSKNNGTPKSSILIGFSIINHPFWGTSIFGNTHVFSPRQDSTDTQQFVTLFFLRCSNFVLWSWHLQSNKKEMPYDSLHDLPPRKPIMKIDGMLKWSLFRGHSAGNGGSAIWRKDPLFPSTSGKLSREMVGWWLGAQWFGFLGSPKTKGIGIFRDTIEYPDSNPKPPTQKSQIFL